MGFDVALQKESSAWIGRFFFTARIRVYARREALNAVRLDRRSRVLTNLHN
jgi:hypothetical protein